MQINEERQWSTEITPGGATGGAHRAIPDSEHGQDTGTALEQVLSSGEAAGPGTSAAFAGSARTWHLCWQSQDLAPVLPLLAEPGELGSSGVPSSSARLQARSRAQVQV